METGFYGSLSEEATDKSYVKDIGINVMFDYVYDILLTLSCGEKKVITVNDTRIIIVKVESIYSDVRDRYHIKVMHKDLGKVAYHNTNDPEEALNYIILCMASSIKLSE